MKCRDKDKHRKFFPYNVDRSGIKVDYDSMGSIELCKTLGHNLSKDIKALKAIETRACNLMQSGDNPYNFDARGLATIITVFSKKICSIKRIS